MIVISMALGAFTIWQTINSYADETSYPTMALEVKGATEDVTWRVLKTQPFYTDFYDDSLPSAEKRAEYENYQLGTPIEKTWTNTDGVVPWWSVSLKELKKCGTVSGVSLANAENGEVLKSIYAQSFETAYQGITYIDTDRDINPYDDEAYNARFTIDGKDSTESDFDWYAFSNLSYFEGPSGAPWNLTSCGSRLNLTDYAEVFFYNGSPIQFVLPESKDQISTVFTIYFNGAERELDLDDSDMEVEAGQTAERVAKPKSSYYGDAEVTYTSSDESVATVDAAGVVTGVAAGEANITASIKNGDKGTSKSYKVSVTKAADPAVDSLVEAINDLPDPDKLTLDDENTVYAAQDAYNALTPEQQAQVTNYNVLLEARLAIAQLKLDQAELDKKAAQDELQAIKDEIAASKLTVSGLKVTSKAKKFTITWKKNAKADGYQVQYRLKGSKKFKTLKTVSKTKVVSKKLKKGKKYQFRVAPYKTINGEKVYGKYSAVKVCKCK